MQRAWHTHPGAPPAQNQESKTQVWEGQRQEEEVRAECGFAGLQGIYVTNECSLCLFITAQDQCHLSKMTLGGPVAVPIQLYITSDWS